MVRSIISVIAAMILTFAGGANAAAGEVRVAVASNFKSVLEQLEAPFEAATGHDLVLSAGSTGKLYAQIVHGAPYDVFLAADRERPARLIEEGRAEGPAVTYAVGQLALWRPDAGEAGPEMLRDGTVKRLAIANPDLAPYGAAAVEVLDTLNFDPELGPKLVRGENIGQTFAFVRTRSADAGFVALSQILVLPEEERGAWWIPPEDSYAPIRQNAVLLSRGTENPAARAFLDYLMSPEIQALIREAGYR